MTDLRKAAEMALERLESHEYWMDEDAIKALRQALAQPEQEPVIGMFEEKLPDQNPPPWVRGYKPNQSEQEPVAWRYRTVTFWNRIPQTRYLESLEGVEGLLGLEPLYTAPPKREWVGLTDDERISFFTKCQNKFWDWDDGVDIEAFIRAIEAKLKEKNT